MGGEPPPKPQKIPPRRPLLILFKVTIHSIFKIVYVRNTHAVFSGGLISVETLSTTSTRSVFIVV